MASSPAHPGDQPIVPAQSPARRDGYQVETGTVCRRIGRAGRGSVAFMG
jgi:hypothetical protein